jgi:flagellar motor switch/type III secretory pathway protein FliN
MADTKRVPQAVDWTRTEFQQLPLTLSARLAIGRAKLGLLRYLETGDVVPLETHVGEPSLLIAEGTPIGAGEVVEIRGRLCLRVTRLGSIPE